MTTPDLTEARRLWPILSAMAHYTAHQHHFDDVDARACTEASLQIRALADEVEHLRARVISTLDAEHAMSDAYVRLREIVGAMSPPAGCHPTMLWSYVESVAKERLRAQVAQTDTERAAWKQWCEDGESEETFLIRLREWAVRMWREEVQNRPLVNVHYGRLDATWRTVMKRAGLDPDEVVGPAASPATTAQQAEPVAWMFQHDETGRCCFCANDGVNTVASFTAANQRHNYVCALYRPNTAAQGVEDERAAFEAWAGGRGMQIAWVPGADTYASAYTAYFWTAWQARAALAQAPAAEPLTDEQITMDGLMMCPTKTLDNCADAFEAGVRYAERAHGIGAA